jgi:hypothetical protein
MTALDPEILSVLTVNQLMLLHLLLQGKGVRSTS